MFCKWCGLESDTPDVCSWCSKPLSAPAPAQDTNTAKAQPPAAEPSAPPAQAVTPPPAGMPAGPAIRSAPLGDFDDDDDLSPLPFGGGSISGASPVAPPPQQPATPKPVPPAAAPKPSAPPAMRPAEPGRGGTGYTPTPIRQPADRPALEAIPIKGAGGGAGGPIPIKTAPAAPKPTAAPPAAQTAAPPTAAPPPAAIPVRGRGAAPLGAADDEPPLARTDGPSLRPGAMPLGDADEEDLPPIAKPRVDLGAAGPRPTAPAPVAASSPARPPQPPTGRTALASPPGGPGARTYYCRWCGLQSETADNCSWCHKDIRHMPAAQGKGPAHVVTTRHQPHGPKKGPQRQPVAKPAPPAKHSPTDSNGVPTITAPQLGSVTTVKSKYYSDKVTDPVSGAHYDADTGQSNEGPIEPAEMDEENTMKALMFNVSFLVVLSLVVGGVASVQPKLYLGLLGISCFLGGLVMPLFRTVPFGEDDSDDVAWFLGMTLLLGPLVGFILYAFIGMVRGGNFSPGIVGVFTTSLILRIAADYGAKMSFMHIMPWNDLSLITVGAQLMPLVTLVGWYSAFVFHKPDE